MANTLEYYRSFSFEELIALPMEQYNEYLALLSEESNRNFHACLASMEDDDHHVDVRGKDCNIAMDVIEPDHVYNRACDMAFHDLVYEYAITDSIRHYLLSSTKIHANAFITGYVCSVCDVLERVICERVVFEHRCSVSVQ